MAKDIELKSKRVWNDQHKKFLTYILRNKKQRRTNEFYIIADDNKLEGL